MILRPARRAWWVVEDRHVRVLLLWMGSVAGAAALVMRGVTEHQTRFDFRIQASILTLMAVALLVTAWFGTLHRLVFEAAFTIAGLLWLGSLGGFAEPLLVVVFAWVGLAVPRPPLDRTSAIFVVASTVGAFAVVVGAALFLMPPGSGHWESVPVAGNRVVYFLYDAQAGDGEAAWNQLCAAEQVRVSPEALAGTKGEAISPALSASTWSLSRHGDHRLAGVDARFSGIEDMEASVTDTWLNVDFRWYGPDRAETWRVDLVREGGQWRVCAMTRV